MSLTLDKMIRASYKLDKLRASEDPNSRCVIVREEDLKSLHESVDKNNSVLSTDARLWMNGKIPEFLGFFAVHPDAVVPAQLNQSIELEGFSYHWKRR